MKCAKCMEAEVLQGNKGVYLTTSRAQLPTENLQVKVSESPLKLWGWLKP